MRYTKSITKYKITMMTLTILLLIITILFVICAYLSQYIQSVYLTKFGISLILFFVIDLLLILNEVLNNF